MGERVTMIDLDRGPDEAPARPGRGRAWLGAVAGLVLGGVAGGLAVHRWDGQQERDQVGVLVLADAGNWVGDRVEAGSTGSAHIYGHVAIVNAGPAPFKFRGLRGVRMSTL